MEIFQPTQWYIFFKDNLLMQKEENGTCSIPYGTKPPVTPPEGQIIHRVLLPTGVTVRTFAIDYPMAETEQTYEKRIKT